MNEYVRSEYSNLAPGTTVQDSEGRDIGVIGDTVDEYVEVRGEDGELRSHWIARSEFGEARSDAVLLGFPSDLIDERSVAQPPGTLEGSAETGALAEQTTEQRETMLREMAEQRADMHESGRATEEADDTVGTPVEEELQQRES